MNREQAIELARQCAKQEAPWQPEEWVVQAILKASPAYISYHRDDESPEGAEAYAAMCACLSSANVKVLANHLAHGVKATLGGARIALTRDDWSEIKFLPLEPRQDR